MSVVRRAWIREEQEKSAVSAKFFFVAISPVCRTGMEEMTEKQFKRSRVKEGEYTLRKNSILGFACVVKVEFQCKFRFEF